MNVVFRVDASIEMGIGHIMRCLTLADALRDEGAQCHFVCREHPGNMIVQIADRGHQICPLPLSQEEQQSESGQVDIEETVLPVHFPWLGCDWMTDARQTEKCIGSQTVDWLIVDHYVLDERWEKHMRSTCPKIMVIDDLADRHHDCDLLLDQTFGRSNQDYEQLVPTGCTIITGAKYALLRPEFAALRKYSLTRRKKPGLEHLLISMGGIDKDNVTGKILQALKECILPEACHITVVMGEKAPWLEDVKTQAKRLQWSVVVRVNVTDMAQLMADSDLAIGAAGSTSWERCCLGIPTIMFVTAKNQKLAARQLEQVGAVILIADDWKPIHLQTNLDKLIISRFFVEKMGGCASEITDGSGISIISKMLKG